MERMHVYTVFIVVNLLIHLHNLQMLGANMTLLHLVNRKTKEQRLNCVECLIKHNIYYCEHYKFFTFIFSNFSNECYLQFLL